MKIILHMDDSINIETAKEMADGFELLEGVLRADVESGKCEKCKNQCNDDLNQQAEKLIAKQAIEMDILKTQNTDYKQRLNEILKHLICIGGPLNDNFDKYSENQAKIFFKIEELADVKG